MVRSSVWSRSRIVVVSSTLGFALAVTAAPAQNTNALLGVWTGVATGPQGAPPSGNITITFEKKTPPAITGKILVVAKGGFQYTGIISRVTLAKRLFSAAATFKLGENPLEVVMAGPLVGNSIKGDFTVSSKGQKVGEGNFSIRKQPRVKQKTDP